MGTGDCDLRVLGTGDCDLRVLGAGDCDLRVTTGTGDFDLRVDLRVTGTGDFDLETGEGIAASRRRVFEAIPLDLRPPLPPTEPPPERLLSPLSEGVERGLPSQCLSLGGDTFPLALPGDILLVLPGEMIAPPWTVDKGAGPGEGVPLGEPFGGVERGFGDWLRLLMPVSAPVRGQARSARGGEGMER